MSETTVSRYRMVLERDDEPGEREVGPRLRDLGAAVEWLQPVIDPWDRQLAGAIFLDPLRYVLGYVIAYVGTRWRVLAEPRGIFLPALLVRAASVIVFLSQPWDDPGPSVEDLRLHVQIRRAGEALGVAVLGFVVVGAGGRWLELAQPPERR